ncbi:hypothetical protein E2C01_011886 [Portunus trituberculatus]|uniref:Uncharacterized protein n=1 Tax=Portunus trituberculatus TaxID=210409 RepID=A0A5B7DD16_PORTR|nr:hypothetical protein [Portunus trituberculatus]
MILPCSFHGVPDCEENRSSQEEWRLPYSLQHNSALVDEVLRCPFTSHAPQILGPETVLLEVRTEYL